MDRSITADDSALLGGSTNRLSSSATGARVEGAAQTAHQTVDRVADKATTQVDRLSGAAHQAVDSATNAVASAAEWASNTAEQAKQTQVRITEAACASIRSRPISTVAGALVVGYLLGRLARF
jgi:ElaB protein